MGQEAVAANGTASTAGGGRARPHAVVMPYPLQGHVIPAVHLALRLAERGFAVTFVNTESVHHQIGAGGDIFAAVRGRAGATTSTTTEDGDHQQELDVRYELVSDGFPLGFDRSLNHDQFMEGVLHVLPAHVEELLRRVVVDPATTPRRRHLLRVAGQAGAEAGRPVRVLLDGAGAHLQPLLPHGPAHQARSLQMQR
ncbi:unnamed protein product [Miscanthus lutarioriparius]|uniref:Uncharacterized protein n=1 Tax=Miscanthus lutarioriparius TaxID=422564 RepID=A0A811MUQ4_9POAL|nr:unnamed protein product [Miscanthus lutarioriparius]